MSTAGRVLIDRDGAILSCDALFDVAMRATGSMVGENALALTAPADRDRCTALIGELLAEGRPLTTIKRLIRSDGTHMWVRNRLALIEHDDVQTIEILIERCAPPAGWLEPAILLAVAQVVFDCRRERDVSFGTILFADQAWDLLLAAYIHEARGGIATIAGIHALTGIPLATGSRWIRALSADGLLEYEDGGNHELVTTPFRLTSSAHAKFERYLSDIAGTRARERLLR